MILYQFFLVYRNLGIFIGKHLSQSLFLNKVACAFLWILWTFLITRYHGEHLLTTASVYAKYARQTAIKCSLKTTKVLLGAIMCLPKFDIKQSTVALNCFKSCETLDVLTFSKKKKKHCLMFGLKFTLFDVTSFLSDNLPELKKFIFKPENH